MERGATRDGGRLLKLPSYPWQTKRFWNETREATESLFYAPVHPLLGQAVTSLHPTWEAEVSTVLNAFLADHRGAGQRRRPRGGVRRDGVGSGQDDLRVEPRCGQPRTASRRHPRRHLRPHSRTTLNEDDGTLEFAAFTVTADGDSKWTITATAELNTLPTAPRRPTRPTAAPIRSPRSTVTTSTPAPEALGFDYGDAFRSVRSVTAGEDWAVADIAVPAAIVDELDDFRFHPALIDGAFQTLFGAPFLGQEEQADPYLPTRIRHCAIYGAPEERMQVHVRVGTATSEEVECDITIPDAAGRTLAVFDGFSVQSLSASSRMSPERIDKGLFEIQWMRTSDEVRTARRRA